MYLVMFLSFGGLLFIQLAVCQNPADNVRANVQPPECRGEKTCNCCITLDCDTCNGQCKDGIFGGKCRNKCPENCESCYDYGAETQESAKEGHGSCTKCKDGYYNVLPNFYQCNYICPVGCLTCHNATQCHTCKEGYYKNSTSEYGTCMNCPSSCVNCSSSTNCSACKSGFEGRICENCTAGFHGDNCTNQCPGGCKNKACYRSSGKCVACKEGYTGAKCDSCSLGKHGLNCEHNCSVNCKEQACDRYNGTCTKGCVANFKRNTCDECVDGKHGTNCIEKCPKNCNLSICIRQTGDCYACMENFQGKKCDECKDGAFFGTYCNNSCSSNCKETTCNEKGVCDKGCKIGYSGDRCCVQGDGCLECSSNFICSKCVDGKHGETCQKNCSTECVEGKCNKENGVCVENIKTDPVPLPIGAIAGGAGGGLVIVAIIALSVVCFVRRRSAKDKGTPYRSDDLSSTENMYENESSIANSITVPKKNKSRKKSGTKAIKLEEIDEDMKPRQSMKSVKAKNDASQAGDEYYNTAAVLKRKIKVRDLDTYVAGKDTDFFEKEFQELPDGLVKSYTDAKKPENMSKNRYNMIYPYDETRVKLFPPGSDFINACYIDGYKKPKEYIASLGPIMKATENFETFWRMVWQENTQKIVMVTNLMERGTMKCEQYWPDNGKKKSYGDVTVTCTSEDSYAEYTMRSFTVSKGGQERQLFHIHYTAWPDKGVPDDVTSLIEFRQKVKATKVEMDGRTIVHCSAGVGRTGTYIALDILTKEGEATQEVDIFGCVSNMRYQRTTMVQTAEQYEYLHHAVVHSLTFGCAAIQSNTLQQYVANSTDAQMKARFKKLHHVREKLSKEEIDAIEINKKMTELNRPEADIPGNRHRPRLFEGRTTEESDYINAIYVNSYKQKDRYIIAQTPLPKTVMDFLTLILQEKVSCIVSMDQTGSEEKTKGTYLPADNQDLKLGKFTVKSSKLKSNQCYVLRKLNVTKSKSVTREVYHYQCNHWDRSSVLPDSPTNFLQLIKDVEKKADENPDNGPVVLHCMNAAERSGLFCAVSILLQKMEVEHEVSVVNTLRQVRVRRSLAIPNKEQYKFCHDCVSTFLQTFDANIYSNFS